MNMDIYMVDAVEWLELKSWIRHRVGILILPRDWLKLTCFIHLTAPTDVRVLNRAAIYVEK